MRLKDLLTQRRIVEAEVAEGQKELQALDVLIARQRQREGLPADSVSASPNGNGDKQKRVRGTLKAAKSTLAAWDVVKFTRAELFRKIEEQNPAFQGKISPEAERSTMRTLQIDKSIVVDNNLGDELVYRKV